MFKKNDVVVRVADDFGSVVRGGRYLVSYSDWADTGLLHHNGCFNTKFFKLASEVPIADGGDLVPEPVNVLSALPPTWLDEKENVPVSVKVIFPSGPTKYSYLNTLKLPLERGDLVIVDTPKSGMCIVKVVNTHFDLSKTPKATKVIAGVVDTTAYDQFQRNTKKLASLESKKQSMLKSFSEEKALRLMAETNPAAAELLHEINELKGTL